MTPWSVVMVVTPWEAWLRGAVKVEAASGPYEAVEALSVTAAGGTVSVTWAVAL